MLTAFIVLQLLLDIEIVAYLVWRHRKKRRAAAAPAPAAATPALPVEPPAWYRDFVMLTEDVMNAIEPVLDALDRGLLHAPRATVASEPAPPPAAAPAPMPRDRHREAFALLRAGTPADEVARREHLSPGQLRLIENLVAAEHRLAAARA